MWECERSLTNGRFDRKAKAWWHKALLTNESTAMAGFPMLVFPLQGKVGPTLPQLMDLLSSLSVVRQPIPSLHNSNCHHTKKHIIKPGTLINISAYINQVNKPKYLVVPEPLEFRGGKGQWERKKRTNWRAIKCHVGSWALREKQCARWEKPWARWVHILLHQGHMAGDVPHTTWSDPTALRDKKY